MNRPKTTTIITIFIIGAIICIAGFCGFRWCNSARDFNILSEKYSQDKKIVYFTSLFVNNMLGSSKDISFEDRLKMENAVRDINNKEIFDQWEKFTKSADGTNAQENAKALLDLIVKNLN